MYFRKISFRKFLTVSRFPDLLKQGAIRHRTSCVGVIWLLLIAGVSLVRAAEKELMYDPEKGIIFIDKDEAAKEKISSNESAVPVPKKQKRVSSHKKTSDIHYGRKKDPPELYFKSGLEYYKNKDYNNALKNFRFADSVEHHAEYSLWIGKTYRHLSRIKEMLKAMFTIIRDEPDSDVADDALFELALYYQMNDDYEKAEKLFTQLIEQYPFGLAYSSGDELREIAREQRRNMRAEMINVLSILGFIADDLPSSYLKFQKANKLPETGIGDVATISAIKKQHLEYQRKEEERVLKEQQFERYRVWIYVVVFGGAINSILLVVLLTRVRARKKHVEELQKIITDLDVAKL